MSFQFCNVTINVLHLICRVTKILFVTYCNNRKSTHYMNTVETEAINPDKRQEILNMFSQVNMRAICKEHGVTYQYVVRVVNGTARITNRYPVALNVLKKAKELYDQKKETIQFINSISL